MKAVLSVVVFVVLAALAKAAPSLTQGELPQETSAVASPPQFARPKRSNYPGQYISPCSGGPVSLAPGPYLPPPVHHGYAPQGYGYGMPHYRAEMPDEHDMMHFSDMEPFMSEHVPVARYAYGPAPAVPHYGGAGLGHLVAPTASGTAFGVFPNANVGGCSVPLLLSCSPSIVPGKIVKGQSQYSYGGSPAAEAYRDVSEHHHQHHEAPQQTEEHQEEQAAHDAAHMTEGHQ